MAEHVQVKTERVRIVQNTLMQQEFLPTLKNPRQTNPRPGFLRANTKPNRVFESEHGQHKPPTRVFESEHGQQRILDTRGV